MQELLNQIEAMQDREEVLLKENRELSAALREYVHHARGLSNGLRATERQLSFYMEEAEALGQELDRLRRGEEYVDKSMPELIDAWVEKVRAADRESDETAAN